MYLSQCVFDVQEWFIFLPFDVHLSFYCHIPGAVLSTSILPALAVSPRHQDIHRPHLRQAACQ